MTDEEAINILHGIRVDNLNLNHLRVKRNLWGMPCEDEHFRDLTINEVAHDISLALGDYVVFDNIEGTATLDVWVKQKARNKE